MTRNEIKTAENLDNKYKIYLVADCFSKNLKLNILNNPVIDNKFRFEEISFKI